MSSAENRQQKNLNKKNEKKLLKILMLHGYRQNEASFREKSGSFRKSLKNHAEFYFCQAPHVIPIHKTNLDNNSSIVQEESQSANDRGWWFSGNDLSYDAIEITDCQIGFDETLDYINETFEKQGPFDGLVSFSQGACLASILCRIVHDNSKIDDLNTIKYKFIKFKFSIFVSGFKSGQSTHNSYYDLNNKIDMPTLHIIGNTDKVIPSEMSMKLVDYFMQPVVKTHEGGHFIPMNVESKNSYLEFLTQMKQKFLSE